VQGQVAAAIEGGQRPLPGLGLAPGERPVQGGGDRPEHQLGGQLVDHLAEPLGPHLAVAARHLNKGNGRSSRREAAFSDLRFPAQRAAAVQETGRWR
jgi:hypothetical protein